MKVNDTEVDTQLTLGKLKPYTPYTDRIRYKYYHLRLQALHHKGAFGLCIDGWDIQKNLRGAGCKLHGGSC